MRLTNKKVVAEALKKLDEVKHLELVRANEGYYYVIGVFKNGSPFVSNGIYVYRLNHMELDSWVRDIVERVKEQMQ